jgi:hypothetical protein
MFMLFSLKLFAPGSSVVLVMLITVAFRMHIHKKLRRGYTFLALPDCYKPSTGQSMSDHAQLEDYTDPALKPPEPFEPSGIEHIDTTEVNNLLTTIQPVEQNLPSLELDKRKSLRKSSSHLYEELDHPPLEEENQEADDHHVMLEVQESDEE